MPEIKSVLCTAYISEESKEKLRQALAPAKVEFYLFIEKDKIAAASEYVDVAIFNGDLDPCILKGKNIKWIHCCRAGIEKSASPEIFARDIVLTCSVGKAAPALAEHALTFMMALTYDLPMLQRAKDQHIWAVSREYAMKTGLHRKTVGIIGTGNTGTELAKLCKAFDMNVLGYRRTNVCPPNIDRIYSAENGDTIRPILEQSDYLVLCMELNDDTWHMIGRGELAAMKPGAYFVNMGRGGLVDEAELIAALQSGHLGGAGLDTFEVEPLPKDSPLWDLPNVIISPHITPQAWNQEERMLDPVFKNIEAYRWGGEFVNRVTERNLLTKK